MGTSILSFVLWTRLVSDTHGLSPSFALNPEVLAVYLNCTVRLDCMRCCEKGGRETRIGSVRFATLGSLQEASNTLHIALSFCFIKSHPGDAKLVARLTENSGSTNLGSIGRNMPPDLT